MNRTFLMPFVLSAALVAMADESATPRYSQFLTGVSSVAENGTPTASGGSWTTYADNGVEISKVDGTTFEFDTSGVDSQNVNNYKPTLSVGTPGPADTNTFVKIDLQVTLEDVGELPASPGNSEPADGLQTAFAVCTNAYHAWNGSNWVVLDEVPAGVDGSQLTNITVEICYQGKHNNSAPNNPRKACFSVGDTVLKPRNANDPWITLTTYKDNLTGVALRGAGTVAKIDASVMLGVAEYDDKKYGTLAEAVAKAATAGGSSGNVGVVTVLRETSENVSVNGNIAIADNGLATGTITAEAGTTVTVKPSAGEFTNAELAGKSGTYTLPLKVSGGTTTVELPVELSNKEVVLPTTPGANNTVQVTIQTAASVLADAKPTGLTAAPTNNIAKLREYLGTYTNEAYVAADVSAATIKDALEATRENGLKLYQSYALGIAPTDSVKPVAVANDDDENNITLKIPALAGKTDSGDYAITYSVNENPVTNPGEEVKIPLPSIPEGTKSKGESYNVMITFADKNN